LGDGTREDRLQPGLVAGDREFVAIDVGESHACALDRGGGAWCWGGNSHGGLGDGTTEERSLPVRVQGGDSFVAIALGTAHTCGLAQDGTAWCWGENVLGQLGDGTAIDRAVPVRVASTVAFVQLDAGAAHTCGLSDDGRAYCWGWNEHGGQVGDGTVVNRPLPTPVATTERFVRIVLGRVAACGIRSDGQAWCWGNNEFGELGGGGPVHLTPVPLDRS
jgi:alpha-tubulin suppressor-like RCC1 family protein